MRRALLAAVVLVSLSVSGCCTLSNGCTEVEGCGGTARGVFHREEAHKSGPVGKWIFGNLLAGGGPIGMLIDVISGHAF